MDDLDLGQTLRGFAAGQQIRSRFTLTRRLGRGGMSVVWLRATGDWSVMSPFAQRADLLGELDPALAVK